MRETVRRAYLAASEGNSPDAVIARPDLNTRFLAECRNEGLADSPTELNLCLLSLRKMGALRGIRSLRNTVPDQDEFRFASEIAVRFLERRDGLTLDRILCDPDRVREFDAMAASLCPGFSAYQYRWAALNLRKRRRLQPELLGRVVAPEQVVACKLDQLDRNSIPGQAGLYLFMNPQGVLYVGECKNLYKRIRKHIEHSDNKGLARWLWEHGTDTVHLEYHVLPRNTSTRVRKAMELELIRSRNPLYNVAGIMP